MSEQPPSFSRAQTSEMQGKEIKSTPRSSGCGCNKRANSSTSSNEVRIQKVRPASSNQIRTQQARPTSSNPVKVQQVRPASSNSPQAQVPEMKGKAVKSKTRSSGCGCNKKAKASTSSNKNRMQQVPSAQKNKSVIRRKKAVNHHTSVIKQDNPVQAKSVSKEPSVTSTNNTNASNTLQPKQQNQVKKKPWYKKIR